MQVSIQYRDQTIQFDSTQGIDLSIPILFTNEYLSAFGVGAPKKKSYEVEGFVGSVKDGGSCNCDVIEIIPHCHTTHTECVGHVLKKPIYVSKVLKSSLFVANLITVQPEADGKISAQILQKISFDKTTDALIIRTLPNDPGKRTRHYSAQAPYLSKDAVEWTNQKDIRHLLVDFPSLDPIHDGGKLEAHRTFWNLKPEQKEMDDKTWSDKTVTELIYVPESVADGQYVLNLQTSHLMLDAVPSSPIIYPARIR